MKALNLGLTVVAAAIALSGCVTILDGNKQEVEIRTSNDEVAHRLDNEATFDLLYSEDRLMYSNIKAGEKVRITRSSKPLTVKVNESECIMPSYERFGNRINKRVSHDTALSTLIDNSTGALWVYDKTLYVTPKIKDTPECKKWLEEVSMKSDAVPSTNSTSAPIKNTNDFTIDSNTPVNPALEKDE